MVGVWERLSLARERSVRGYVTTPTSYPLSHAWVGPARLGPRSGNEARTKNRRACWQLRILAMA